MKENLDFRDMESFVMLCRLRSFTKAAEYLFISQSALSRRIKSLEEQLGVELVKRGGTTLEMTREGEWFYQSCLRMLKEKEELCYCMQRFQAKEEGVLRIFYDAVTILWPRILNAIMQLRSTYPQMQVELIRDDFLDIGNALSENRADACLTEASWIEDQAAFSWTLIGEDHLMACLSHHHALLRKPFLILEELDPEKIIFAFSAQDLDFMKLVNRGGSLGSLFS